MYSILERKVPGTNYAISLDLHIRFPFLYFLRALLVDAVSFKVLHVAFRQQLVKIG